MVTLAQFLLSPIRYFRMATDGGLIVVTPFGALEIRRLPHEEETRSEER